MLAGQPVAALGLPFVQSPRVSFRIVRTMTSSPDTASVAIYGLDPIRRAAMQSIWTGFGAAPLTIATGYDAVTIPVFFGDVRSLSSSLEGADYVTTATADDAGDAIEDAAIPPELISTAELSASVMVTIALACFNSFRAYVPPAKPPLIPIVPSPSVGAALATMTPQAQTLTYASVRVGKARDLLDEAARIVGCRWWIRDSQLFFGKRGVPTSAAPIALPRSHWLSVPSEEANGTIRVTAFLEPQLLPGALVSLIGRTAPGVPELCRVEAGEYSGDTDAGVPFSASLVLRRTT